MKKNIFSFANKWVILCLPTLLAFAPVTFVLLTSIKSSSDIFTTDNLGNTYLTKTDELIKYNIQGELISTYSNKTYGKITAVDASNPFKTLVYYQDFSKIIFLDNMLSATGNIISLESLGQPSLAATSYNNGIWTYNPQNSELIRINENFEVVVKKTNLSQVLNINLYPTHMQENNNWLYMSNPQTGILVFDIYGTYNKTIPIKDVSHFQVLGDVLYYQKRDMLYHFNMNSMEMREISLPDTLVRSARVENQKVFIQKTDKIDIYQMN